VPRPGSRCGDRLRSPLCASSSASRISVGRGRCRVPIRRRDALTGASLRVEPDPTGPGTSTRPTCDRSCEHGRREPGASPQSGLSLADIGAVNGVAIGCHVIDRERDEIATQLAVKQPLRLVWAHRERQLLRLLPRPTMVSPRLATQPSIGRPAQRLSRQRFS
jgi:hypothetical protein